MANSTSNAAGSGPRWRSGAESRCGYALPSPALASSQENRHHPASQPQANQHRHLQAIQFVEALGARMEALVVGDPRDSGTQMGPVVDQSQLDQDLRYLEIAVSEGADLRCGQRLSGDTQGYYLRPALLVGTSNQHTVNREEVFGPVASVIRVVDYDEALATANYTIFGLTAGIATRSLAAAHDFRRRSTAGMVMVNLATAGVDYHVPLGGRGASSHGPREQGAAALDFYTGSKTSYVVSGPVDAEW